MMKMWLTISFVLMRLLIECSICNNFGHEDYECRSKFRQTKEQASSTKTWRIKEPQPERFGIAFYAEGQENQWYIDSGCSKHMTGDKEKLEPYSVLEKRKKVYFGNTSLLHPRQRVILMQQGGISKSPKEMNR